MGEEYLRDDRVVTAEALFQQAVSKRSSYVPARLGLARTLRRAGDHAGAVGQYEEVIRQEPENRPARQELASLLAKGNGR
jgi:cytochrome c-type biogenesis protein CcmH/NrfG